MAQNKKSGKLDLCDISEALGYSGWQASRGLQNDGFPKRGSLTKLGRECQVTLNSFPVTKFLGVQVNQYDVAITGKHEPKGTVLKKVWESEGVKKKLGHEGRGWIFDGMSLAWAVHKVDNVNITVDLDEEKGKVSPPGKGDCFRFEMRYTKSLDSEVLAQYLTGKVPMSDNVIEIISFLDHLMRETPSKKYKSIKRSFYRFNEQNRTSLGNGIETTRGAYASMRIVNLGGAAGLAVNVDSANGTFWKPQNLMSSVLELLSLGNNVGSLQKKFHAERNTWMVSGLRRELKRYRHVPVYFKNPKTQRIDEYKIDSFSKESAQERKFNEITGGKSRMVSVAQYFQSKYDLKCLQMVPLVKMTKGAGQGADKGTYLPLEHLYIAENARYPYKLDERQTSQMIRFAVTEPSVRWSHIEAARSMLSWDQDPILRDYGLTISKDAIKVKGRVLQAPDIQFLGSKLNSDQVRAGRWRIDGRKFIKPNPEPLQAWGICVMNRTVDHATTQAFAAKLLSTYASHGGQMKPEAKSPWIGEGTILELEGGQLVEKAWQSTGKKFNRRPQLLLFIFSDRNPSTYNRIKLNCECRYGVASQVVQGAHVQKMQPQYISNVLMKINAKLGGATCQAVGSALTSIKSNIKQIKTMCIGADVSHPPPSAPQMPEELQDPYERASFGAITVSMDKDHLRYASLVDTNGQRVEMLTTGNIEKHLGALAKRWMETLGAGQNPDRIFYFRDGVSEGQYAHVLEQEVRDMKNVFRSLSPNSKQPQFVVLIATKRHHIRFFPDKSAGDAKSNPVPGVLVELGVTHPFEFDFYLCAHSAIKGTARPIHYHVLMNEPNLKPDELQQFIFENSFQYARSTTPVSLFPAVYYAHLASKRGRAHRPKPAGKNKGNDAIKQQKEEITSSSDKTPAEIPSLLDINNSGGLKWGMWYI